MKTIYLTSLCKLKRGRYLRPDDYDKYVEMYEMSKKSWMTHVDIDECILNQAEGIEDIQEMFKGHFFLIYELWKAEPCNILYCGPDTLCVSPIDFSEFKEFRMFNYTHPKSMFGFHDYFNADIRYYPHTMSQEIG